MLTEVSHPVLFALGQSAQGCSPRPLRIGRLGQRDAQNVRPDLSGKNGFRAKEVYDVQKEKPALIACSVLPHEHPEGKEESLLLAIKAMPIY